MLNIRFFLFLVLSLLTFQSWAAIVAPDFVPPYSYDAGIRYDYIDVVTEKAGISSKKHFYDGGSNLSLCCSKYPPKINSANVREGYFFALVSGFNVTKGTGTVWDSVKATQGAIKGTSIPKSFELAVDGGKFWVHPNATKHMAEYLTRNGMSHGTAMSS